MATTAQSIVTQAWVDLGVGSPGDIMPASEAANALVKLNMRLDAMSAVRDLIFEILITSYALSNAQSFPIGPTGAAPFNVTRPVKIENATIGITVGGKILEFPLKLIGQSEWEDIPDKGATGTVPDKLYYDPQVPNAVLNFHPIPLATATTVVNLGTWTQVQQFANLAASATLPPAYLLLLNLALQLDLVPTYGRLINPQIVQMRTAQYNDALAIVRSLNSAIQMEALGPVSTTPPQPQAALQAR